MLHLFAGDDVKNKNSAFEKFLKSVSTDTETFFINRNEFDRNQIESLYSGSGLFFKKCAVVFRGILEREDERDFILGKLDLLAASGNTFVFSEGKLSKTVLDLFTKNDGAVNLFELPKEFKEKYDNFLVANAFGARDKLNLWIHFRAAMDLGVGMEEIVGVLFWKIKDMLLKRNLGKFSEAELKNSAARLSYLLPEARKRGADAEEAFEQFLLEAF